MTHTKNVGIDLPVPFIGNTADNKHCLQSAYGMVRRYFEPELEVEPVIWEAATGYLEGRGSWSTAGLLWFARRAYTVWHITMFDYDAFIQAGPGYLREALGSVHGDWAIEHIDIPLEQTRARDMLNAGILVRRVPTIQDIKHYLDRGYLVKCPINLLLLNDEEGYLEHAVIIKGYRDGELIVHDPGLPAWADRHVAEGKFAACWGAYDEQMRQIDAIWLPRHPHGSVAPSVLRRF